MFLHVVVQIDNRNLMFTCLVGQHLIGMNLIRDVDHKFLISRHVEIVAFATVVSHISKEPGHVTKGNYYYSFLSLCCSKLSAGVVFVGSCSASRCHHESRRAGARARCCGQPNRYASFSQGRAYRVSTSRLQHTPSCKAPQASSTQQSSMV